MYRKIISELCMIVATALISAVVAQLINFTSIEQVFAILALACVLIGLSRSKLMQS